MLPDFCLVIQKTLKITPMRLDETQRETINSTF
nr:MAG TPA: hypothetical protein [Bacteriophage sp.]